MYDIVVRALDSRCRDRVGELGEEEQLDALSQYKTNFHTWYSDHFARRDNVFVAILQLAIRNRNKRRLCAA